MGDVVQALKEGIAVAVAMPPDIVRQNLDQMIERLTVKSKRTWEHRGKAETKSDVPQVWNRLRTREGAISYVINEQHPLVKKLIDQAPSIKNDLNKLLEEIASSLPFNQLMIDLNGNNAIGNAESVSKERR